MKSERERDSKTSELRPDDLAAEFLAQRSEGVAVSVESYVERLSREADRAEFKSLVAGAERVERSLPRALSEGTLLCGRYRILHEIGAGGMGRVFAAFDQQLERKVAVKVLSALGAGHAEREVMFMKESRLLATLQHPNIVAVHEAGRDEELTYIVMDLVDGTSLDRVIEAAAREIEASSSAASLRPRSGATLERAIGKATPDGRANLLTQDWFESVARIALELSRTLEAAHGKHVIHRDLKPGNVMLLGGGTPIVLDFGLAGSMKGQTGSVTQGLYGSVAYLAPEQATSQQVGMDPRTDVYQLGLILYELVTLRRAFPGQAIGDVLERIQHGEFMRPRAHNSSVPADLEAICMMALELDPSKRYSTARALREDLERYVERREAPLALRSNRVRALARSTRYQLRRHPWRVAAAGMVSVGLIVGVLANSLRASAATLLDPVVWSSGEKWRPVRNGDVVNIGERLGVEVKTNERSYVYAMSVFEGPDGKKRVAPMKPAPESDPTRAERAGEHFGLALDAGEHNVFVSSVTPLDEGEGVNPVEGLRVWTTPRERPELEFFMQDLEARVQNAYPKGVPFEDAKELLAAAHEPGGRGVKQSPWTASELASIAAELRQRSADDGDVLALRGTTTVQVECRVEPVK